MRHDGVSTGLYSFVGQSYVHNFTKKHNFHDLNVYFKLSTEMLKADFTETKVRKRNLLKTMAATRAQPSAFHQKCTIADVVLPQPEDCSVPIVL